MPAVRVVWEGMGSGGGAADAERALFARLQARCPDLEVAEPRQAVPDLPGAWRIGLVGTKNGERVRTLVLVAERGAARVTCLASCAQPAWEDGRPALAAILESFRWL